MEANARQFVLSQPADLPAQEIVTLARLKGIHITSHAVGAVRRRKSERSSSSTTPANQQQYSELEQQLLRLATRLGIDRSRQLLDAHEQSFS